MILGALVDAGLPFEALRDGLAGLDLGGYSIERREVMKGAFRATKVDVHVHDHGHDAGEGPGHAHARPHGKHAHPRRTLPDILGILGRSGLPGPVRDNAARVFRRLAEAEARVHGVSVDEVHFHDVGAVDAIVDVTGACLGLHLLGIEALHCSALPLGGGSVTGPHGRIPVPAPGTAELLRGFPVVDTGVKRELVTPTGAAILTTLASGAGAMPAMTVSAVGYGAGSMELEMPNLIRLFVGEGASPLDPMGAATETVCQVETTVDDMSPQLWEPLMDRLFEAGALDVYLTSVLMKKSRPGVVLTALCEPGDVGALAQALFQESTTIGVRWTPWQRQRLPREMVRLETSYGAVAFKVSRLGDRVVTVTPEFDEVRRIARDRGLPVREVLDQARAEGRRLLTSDPGPA
ncbi:MAG: TIGR00299 family protein [Candidatus Rokubacteria bacterium GWC2_70_16]|nr:MAG: TIGR00299 family protein [Candidatus Rokubacteria bacterium GWC2_70_16]OGL16868.1 MAG: TIGR00299 family protein [Candidatus Rokubacteria bacterium RIFCSPLOWO2_12_FULL_71_19]